MSLVRTFIPGLAIGLALVLFAYAAGWLRFGSQDPPAVRLGEQSLRSRGAFAEGL